MSFAEEPIKSSKPFVTNGSTNGPADKYNVTESLPAKSEVNNLILLPTSAPTKFKPEKSVVYSTEQPQENITSAYSTLTAAPSVLTNSTPAEESHEIFNSDKDRETFQNSAVVKKSVKMEVVENVPNSLKSIISKSSESEEEAALSDRTYNIEGTFDSDDFVNGADPINVYKKIDLNPLDSATKEYPSTSDPVFKSSEYPSTPSILFQSTNKVLASTLNEEHVTTAPNYTSSATTSTNLRVDIPLSNQTTTSPVTSPKPRKFSPLLSGALEAEEISPKRKRRLVNPDRRASYPSILGRILG